MDADVVVLGATLTGCSAALEARRLGAEVVLVADVSGGGGFGPKATLHSMILRAAAATLSERCGDGHLSTSAQEDLFRSAWDAVLHYRTRLRDRIERAGVHIETRSCRFLSPSELVLAGSDRCSAGSVIVATGGSPRRPERFPFDGAAVCDPGLLLERRGALRNALIVGAEGTGCEVASILAATGASVTLLDRRHRFLRAVDGEVRDFLHGAFRREGVEVVLGETVRAVEVREHRGGRHAVVQLGSGPVEHCDCVVVDAGELPATGGIQLEQARVETDPRGFIIADEWGRTSEPGVYAAGRVAGSDLGDRDEWSRGRTAALTALGFPADPNELASGSWHTIPPIACVGLTSEACSKLEVPHVVGRARYVDSLWARLNGLSNGLVKLVADNEAGLFGVHVIGQRAGELIDLGSQLASSGATLERIASATTSSRAIGEMYQLAALDALGSATPGGKRGNPVE